MRKVSHVWAELSASPAVMAEVRVLWDCGTQEGATFTFDADSECYARIKAMLAPPAPDTSALPTDAARMFAAESQGLGDDVERIARAIGADRVAKAFEDLTGWPCNCDARKRLFNKLPSIMAMLGR